MSECQNCSAKNELNLCTDCVGMLKEALDAIPWLLMELDVTVTRQDRLNTGVVGKSSENPSPMNVGAAALATEVEGLLVEWIGLLSDSFHVQFFPAMAVGNAFIGPLRVGWRRLPKGYTASPTQYARWLSHHVGLIARHDKAGEIYSAVVDLTGDPDKPSKPGRLVRAIDRTVRIYAGTCPTLVGRDREGAPVECSFDLWAEDGMTEVTCGKCEQEIDVKANRAKVVTDRDLLPEKRLTEIMADLGEPVYSDLLQRWLRSGALKPSGYLSGSRIVPHRVNSSDARLLSLSRVRQLRWMHQQELSAVAS